MIVTSCIGAKGGNYFQQINGGVRELMLSVGQIDTEKPNPKNNGEKIAKHVWIHRSEWYTNGCFVVPNTQWNEFIGYFRAGDKGSITLKRKD